MNNCYQTGEAQQWFQCCHQAVTDLFLFNTNLFFLLLFHLRPDTGIKTGCCLSPDSSKCLLQGRCRERGQVCRVCSPWYRRRPREEEPAGSWFAGSCFLSGDAPSPWASSAGCERLTTDGELSPGSALHCGAAELTGAAGWWKRSPSWWLTMPTCLASSVMRIVWPIWWQSANPKLW